MISWDIKWVVDHSNDVCRTLDRVWDVEVNVV